ncbi:Splicing factor ESS-2-like protein [Frankliniella fusca]|uniref:Splicing factor ESS-2-like protein n=1 Tax=Frankliniella fusca TaxID=407009 RepID=A0AAE1H2W3_9NEOP|nr:Splicing factor ESS-2-like protein [Frankliniella fusca]
MSDTSSSCSSPGNKALQIMKTAEDLQLFKKPGAPVSGRVRKKQKVLEEDVYIEQIGKIIERDFFPDLEKLRAQNQYLEAMDQNDVFKMRELYAKYSSGAKPAIERCASPATFETPIANRLDDSEPSRDEMSDQSKKENNDDSSGSKQDGTRRLDAFLSAHTSEDNESFQEIMKEADIRHRHRYGWLYQDEEASAKKVEEQLALPSIEKQGEIADRPFNIDTWKFKNRNYIMYVPEGSPLSEEDKIELANKRQEIVHTNTRLKKNPFDERQNKEVIKGLAVTQARAQDGKIGVDGKELTTETPKVNGFSYVKMDSPMPGVMDSPLMTWGEIEGTPFRLDGGDTPVRPSQGPCFKMNAPPKREKIALALAEKAGERHRERKLKALEAARRLASPSPRPGTGPLERLSSMSPAAQRLATNKLRPGDSALRASYTPSPQRRSGGVTPGPSTPLLTPSTTPLRQTPTRRLKPPTPKITSLMTDNLLKLPHRARASDFF